MTHMLKNKKVGLVLGSGAARGLAHIGVIKVLEQFKIPIHYVVGSSMGALIGGLYASGLTGTDLERIASSINWVKILKILFPGKMSTRGLLQGKRVINFIREHVKIDDMQKLPTPFTAVATDLWSGNMELISEGDLALAIRASISFPFLFTPYKYNHKILVDGGVVNPLPIDVARANNCDLIIAVDVTPSPARRLKQIKNKSDNSRTNLIKIPSSISFKYSDRLNMALDQYMKRMFQRATRDKVENPNIRYQLAQIGNIMEAEIGRLRIQLFKPDILIKPELDDIDFFDMYRYNEIIAAGETGAKAILDEYFRTNTAKRRQQ